MLMALHDKPNVANRPIPSKLKYHDDNPYKTAVGWRICLYLQSALGCRRVNESDPVDM